MSADNQQERPDRMTRRPNYRSTYVGRTKGDSLTSESYFWAPTDERALIMANNHIERLNKEDRAQRERERTNDGFHYVLLNLERLAYVTKVVEESTPIPLK